MERNPNHPVVNKAREEWHKFCAIVLHKTGKTEMEITSQDVDNFTNSGLANIVLDCRGGRLVLRLVSDEEGERLARKEGGLPV